MYTNASDAGAALGPEGFTALDFMVLMSADPDIERFRIGELAARVGTTARAIRYYEDFGLLPTRDRGAGSHRLYDASDEARLRELLHLRGALGLSLSELRDMTDASLARADLRERFHASPDPGQTKHILREALQHLDAQLALIQSRRASLDALEAELTEKRRRIHAVASDLPDQA